MKDADAAAEMCLNLEKLAARHAPPPQIVVLAMLRVVGDGEAVRRAIETACRSRDPSLTRANMHVLTIFGISN
jgi:hypothetical protein